MSFNESETEPTIETVLARINNLGETLQAQLNSLHADVGVLKSDVSTLKSNVSTLKVDMASVKSEMRGLRSEFQLFRGEMEVRIDRIDGMASQTRAEMLNLRADLKDWENKT